MKWTDGQLLYLIGNSQPSVGGSEYLSTIHGEVTGNPPHLDLATECAVQAAVRTLIADDLTVTAHDLSLGGLAVALAKMAVVSGIGASVDSRVILERSRRVDEAWFGESASQILVTCDPAARDRFESTLAAAGVAFTALGETGGEQLDLGLVAIDLSALRAAFDRAFDLPDVSGAA
jgi:phosphoribosylformylglycinamidine synthase